MKKENMKIKSDIDMVDQINAIEYIVASYFTGGDYTPYYATIGEVSAIIKFFIEGVEFEENESYYNCYLHDLELKKLVGKFLGSTYDEENKYIPIMDYVNGMVDKIVQFRKDRLIHSSAELESIANTLKRLDEGMDSISSLNTGTLSEADMSMALDVLRKLSEKEITKESIIDVIKESSDFNIDEATAEIIDDKNRQIDELKKYKTLWESRNVMSNDSNKVIPMK